MSEQPAVEPKETKAEPVYVIFRGFEEGKSLTTAQKNSALFSEEPVVLGKVLRRGSKPMVIPQSRFKKFESQLRRLEKAGAITIAEPIDIAKAIQGVVDHVSKHTNTSYTGAGDAPQQEGVEVTAEGGSSPPAVEDPADPPPVIVPPPPAEPAPEDPEDEEKTPTEPPVESKQEDIITSPQTPKAKARRGGK